MNRPVYTASVSKIDSFDKWINRQTEDNESWNNEETFLQTLRGEFKQLPTAKYGECFHAIVEDTAKYTTISYKDKNDQLQYSTGYQLNEIFIPDTQAKHAIEYREAHPMLTKELVINKRYSLRHFDLIITGRVDGLEGNWVRDTKTKYGQVDVLSDYMQSTQWKFYLDMLGLDIFWYDIFQVSGYEKVEDCLRTKIKPLEPMMLRRYDNMHPELLSVLHDFEDYIIHKDFYRYISVPVYSPLANQYGLYKDVVYTDDYVITFGKHYGKRLCEVPDYLQWWWQNKPVPAALREYILNKGIVALT